MDYYELMIKELMESKVPLHIRKDVLSRSMDWFESGGEVGDDYIKRQYEYILQIKNMM